MGKCWCDLRMNRLLAILCFFCFSLALSIPVRADAQLFKLIDDRLALMEAVAAYKWSKDLAIEDKEREKLVLDNTLAMATRAGIDAESSHHFFQVQIEAAKEIQFFWLDQWEKNNKNPVSASRTQKPDNSDSGKEDNLKNTNRPNQVKNLRDELRPKLNRIGQDIIGRMSKTGRLEHSRVLKKQFYRAVQTEGVSQGTKEKLYRALLEVHQTFYETLLEKIQHKKILRVATTGDYAPFSAINDSQANDLQANDSHKDGSEYVGIDIDLAENLASSLQAQIVWVQTSWPTLLKDLKENRFDIAMSGISYNEERERFGHFSIPYHKGGKTPISRCEDVKKLNNLNKINQAHVRVIVNPGGTNFRFASSELTRAEVRTFEDNRLIFQEIINNTADVMITDAIEVRMQSKRIKGLCPTMPGRTLTYLEKAYLMPQDRALQKYVNQWLQSAISKGLVSKTFDRHLN